MVLVAGMARSYTPAYNIRSRAQIFCWDAFQALCTSCCNLSDLEGISHALPLRKWDQVYYHDLHGCWEGVSEAVEILVGTKDNVSCFQKATGKTKFKKEIRYALTFERKKETVHVVILLKEVYGTQRRIKNVSSRTHTHARARVYKTHCCGYQQIICLMLNH